MKKIFLITVLLLACIVTNAGKQITKDGVQYNVLTSTTATASLTVQAKGDVAILERIRIGNVYYNVTQINSAYFKSNSRITSVVLPNTITTIGDRAFAGCTKLQKIVFPIGAYTIGKDAFTECYNITDIQGNTVPYSAAKNNLDKSTTSNEFNGSIPKFYTYAKDKLTRQMEEWQMKKAYETVEQYKARVTEEKRLLRMKEFEKELQEEYAALFAPKTISTMVGGYDSEYEVFTILTTFGNVYAKVPKADARSFRQNYNSVVVTPHFGVQGDTLSILSCNFQYKGKTYANAESYEENGSLDYQFDLPPLDIEEAIAAEEKQKPVRKTLDLSIDKEIPLNKTDNDKMFVLVIGNENYKRIADVPYANNDAKVFAEYCQKTLGVPKKNIDIYKDASINDMRHAVQVLSNRLKAFNGEAKALVYYSGHGYPDEATRMPYLMPIDGFASDVSNTGYSLNDMYDELAEAPSQLTLLLIDACFSGTTRQGDMAVNAKSIAVAARSIVPTGNMMVFSASQDTETAYVDEEHGHGRFTYYLLKHLHNTKGDTTLGGLVDFVTDQVGKASVINNDGKTQTPTPNPSFRLGENWKSMKLR